MPLQLAPERDIAAIDDCYFYHVVNLPTHGEIKAEWDLRGAETEIFGGLNFQDSTVLEIGAASGYLTFWLEDQGADVTAFDLSDQQQWDVVPFADSNLDEVIAVRRQHMKKLNNAWWYARKVLNKRAKKIYGSVYELSPEIGQFQTVTLCNILLHLRDPFLALQKASSLSQKYLVINELSQPFSLWDESPIQAAAGQNFCQFLPKYSKQLPWDTWWYLPEATLIEMLQILGFKVVHNARFKTTFMDGQPYEFVCLVGERAGAS